MQLDFADVLAVTPSWIDEFLALLIDHVGLQQVELLPTTNPSVVATLHVLAEAEEEPVADLAKQFLQTLQQR